MTNPWQPLADPDDEYNRTMNEVQRSKKSTRTDTRYIAIAGAITKLVATLKYDTAEGEELDAIAKQLVKDFSSSCGTLESALRRTETYIRENAEKSRTKK